MSEAPTAKALARALLALTRTEASGVLEVEAPTGLARIQIEKGQVTAMSLSGDDAPLGDLLAEVGQLNVRVHRKALRRGGPEGPVGKWLVDSGAASAPAVTHALRRQVVSRLIRVCQWGSAEFSFRVGIDLGLPALSSPVPPARLVLCAMKESVAEMDRTELLSSLGTGLLSLSSLGEGVLTTMPLRPHEQHLFNALKDGTTGSEIDKLGGIVALRTAVALSGLRGLKRPGRTDQPYSLLLQKQRQARHRVPPSALLDISPSASAREAKAAFKRLAGRLHPDAFGRHVPNEVKAACNEVIAALSDAKSSFR